MVVGLLPPAATLRGGSWSTRGALAFELVVPFSGATHLFSGKLPAFGVASKIPAMKFLDPDTESAVRDFLARIPSGVIEAFRSHAVQSGQIDRQLAGWSISRAPQATDARIGLGREAPCERPALFVLRKFLFGRGPARRVRRPGRLEHA